MKNEEKKLKMVKKSHQDYIQFVSRFLARAEASIEQTPVMGSELNVLVHAAKVLEIEGYITHTKRQIEQINRRVLDGEVIPHGEKVFSIFKPHTEWISKGKAGVPQELGLRICIVEDNLGFVLHHKVMEKETDDKVAVWIIEETKEKFPELDGCSFDKGFYSPDNRKDLNKILSHVTLPKKGRKTLADKELEGSKEFIEARRAHSAVESAINALENHGLDRCRDHGIKGFKRYVALSVLARNIQILGHLIQQEKLEEQKRLEKSKRKKLAA